MDSLKEITAVYEHKKQLQKRLETLKKELEEAKQAEQEALMNCERENLDTRKFEGSDFAQFWYKLRGQYESRILENNEKAAEAVRALNEAKSRVFDITEEKTALEKELSELGGVEEAYRKAFAMHVEHLDYSIHRDEILRMQKKISHDDEQLKLLAKAGDIRSLAARRVKKLEEDLAALDSAKDETQQDKLQVVIISDLSELRIQLDQLEKILGKIDALETESMIFGEYLTINALDLFFNKDSVAMVKSVHERAERELKRVTDRLDECELWLKQLLLDIEKTKKMHQQQLEQFINETVI